MFNVIGAKKSLFLVFLFVAILVLHGHVSTAFAETASKLSPPQMLIVEGGCFQMGDTFDEGDRNEHPAHNVCVDSFTIAAAEVTQELWKEVMGALPAQFIDCDACPVVNVSWNDAQTFIAKLNQLTNSQYRLPTEAEWEYAARSGGKRERWAGTNKETDISDYAWYAPNSDRRFHAVKQKRPNTVGAYDMTGNVWEWVHDWYDGDYYRDSPEMNPKGPATGDSKGLRGGSWAFTPKGIRTTVRASSPPDHSFVDIGFRLIAPAGGDMVVYK